jgi:hypothetical protein
MFYIRLADNKYPLTETQVRAAFPNTSFPKDLGEPEGYAAIVFKPAPAVDQTLQQVVETTPALVNGEYAQQWRVLNLTAETVEANIATAKASQWKAIKAKRDSLSDTGGYKVVVGGVNKWFHSDAKSKTQQLGLVMAGPDIPPVPWKTMDGSFVTMSQSLAGQILQAAMQQDQAIFAAAESHNAEMLTEADPAAYDFSAGWPETYVG